MIWELILLQANGLGIPTQNLLDYGALGIFLISLLIVVRFLAKEYKNQSSIIIATYTNQIKLIVDEKNFVLAEKDDINKRFFDHLQDSESRLLDVITENSRAFNKMAESASQLNQIIKESLNKNNN